MATSPTAPELINGLNASFHPAEWTGVDTSGILPLGPHVIILCDVVSEITSGAGGVAMGGVGGKGIALPSDMQERMNLASEQGVIAALAKGAFAIHEDGRSWDDYRPVPGDRVYFEKYAGRQARGTDGKVYRIMDYRCIAAIYRKGGDA